MHRRFLPSGVSSGSETDSRGLCLEGLLSPSGGRDKLERRRSSLPSVACGASYKITFGTINGSGLRDGGVRGASSVLTLNSLQYEAGKGESVRLTTNSSLSS